MLWGGELHTTTLGDKDPGVSRTISPYVLAVAGQELQMNSGCSWQNC